MTQERYEIALADLAQDIGLDGSALAQYEELVIDGVAIALSYEADEMGGSMQGACYVGTDPLSVDASSNLLRVLLQANTLGAPTLGATLGLQRSGRLVLSRREPLDAPPDRLARVWGELADASARWAIALEEGLETRAKELVHGEGN
ncbi:type III secretion system chaperone [Ottowia thiooxydans]|uniref:type III secretion system chaperone n=1 Tax=Ottowia thiooxydans TaxID=219182 RepID=UPI000416019C|nr:type III secretion system chaperone [Ottowia thiooxydans]